MFKQTVASNIKCIVIGQDLCNLVYISARTPHSSAAPPQHMHMGNMMSMGNMAPAQPQGTMAFAPHPSMMNVAPPAAAAPHKNEDDDDEDYDS